MKLSNSLTIYFLFIYHQLTVYSYSSHKFKTSVFLKFNQKFALRDQLADKNVQDTDTNVGKISKKRVLLKDKFGIPTEKIIPGVNIKASRPPDSMQRKVSTIKSGGSGISKGKILPQGKARSKDIINPSRLKILAGTAKGKKIDSPDVYLRPMMAKVREALYSTLQFIGLFDANTTNVLDIFSGSGSVGLEALSRGAASVTFVDMSNDCCQVALMNADKCGFAGQARAINSRAEELLSFPERFAVDKPFQLISITPPYEEVIYKDLIDKICNSKLVEENTIVVIEYPVEMGTLPHILGEDKLYGIRNRKYGRTVLGIYVYRPTRQFDLRPDEFMTL